MRIPPHAKRVFKGHIFDVYQWEQERFDGTKATWESLKRNDIVQVIATRGGRILLGDEEQPARPPFIALFGGQVDDGEEPLAAAKRELLEETGMASDDWVHLWSRDITSKMDFEVHLFVARNCRKAAEPHPDPGERISVREVSLSEFYESLYSPSFRAKDIAFDIVRLRHEGKGEEFERKLFPDRA